ncbi:MAG: 3-isopropylmalate dehydratase [Peptococcaceae bacterium BICA1-8]|nr:MAG: 3-isopropylmalate dehydratase [Peptococcaceae bacterium BICA1-8]
MDDFILKGRVWKFGDNISTDHILPSRYMTHVEPHELAANCMKGTDPDFFSKIHPGDIIVAGENIGYGSSREQAPQAIKCAQIGAVVAKSFARIFYRNCYNVGLPAIMAPDFVLDVNQGDLIEINYTQGGITNLTTGKKYEFIKPPDFLVEYIELGGLIPYLEKQLKK